MLVGCVDELALFHEWIENIPHKLSLSRVILAWYKHGNQPCAMNLQADYGRKKKDNWRR